ncbi:nucleoporin NUP188 [Oncorhynchus tshawytscha]|uniref:nucleoporin NUP188 n=1 Tax=Oncorhynchus tshawytscha TaxID=74940 RepID=UPI000D0A81C7|nr:nucleoporin NUP188 [Oncorhynchus tshawytscha]
MANVITELKDMPKLAITSDGWTSLCQDHYLTVKVHYTSQGSNATCGQIIPIHHKLEEHVTVKHEDATFVATIKAKVWENLTEPYQDEDIQAFLHEATAMDPRFKGRQHQGCQRSRSRQTQSTSNRRRSLKEKTVAPMSVYACLGGDVAAIRDTFLTRLQSKTEDMRIKVMILELLTMAVETQPGLIELFLNLEVKDSAEESKAVDSEFSYLKYLSFSPSFPLRIFCWVSGAGAVGPDRLGSRECTGVPPLHRANLAFLHALWQDQRDRAISVLRTNSSLEQTLKDALQKFSSGRHYWSQYVKSLVVHIAETEEEGMRSFSETQMVMSAWFLLLIFSTSHSDVMQLNEDSARLKLFMDVLNGTKAVLLVPRSVHCLRLGSMMTTLLLILLKQWRSVVATTSDVLSPLSLILESVLQTDQQLMAKAKVFSALISALQMQGLDGMEGNNRCGEICQLPQLLLCVCETVQDEALALIDSTHHTAQAGDVPKDKDRMETDAPSSVQKDQRDGCVCWRYTWLWSCVMTTRNTGF